MDALDLILTRRSVLARNMVAPGPNDDQLEAILRAGIRVPDHGKLAPWRVQVIDAAGQRALADLFLSLIHI